MVHEFSEPLELVHCIGFTSQLPECLCFHPRYEGQYIHPVSNFLCVGHVDNPHEQSLCKGHTTPISCICMSHNGKYMCSGQGQTQHSNILVWDFLSKQPIYEFPGHKGGVRGCKFSPDDKWLASIGVDNALCIWDLSTGQVAGGHKENSTDVRWLQWGTLENAHTRRPKYTLVLGLESDIRVCTWEFSVQAMSFELSCLPCGAGGGVSRHYTCGCVAADLCLAGTTTGDIVQHSFPNGAYCGTVAVANNGIMALLTIDDCTVVVGGGDGKLKVIKRSGKSWSVTDETALVGGVNNITVSCDQQELLCGTKSGFLYRCLAADLQSFTVVERSHIAGVTGLAFPKDVSECFATTSKDGYVRQWDLSDYSQTSFFTLPNKSITPHALAYTDRSHVVTGWSDGTVRCISLAEEQGYMVWNTPNAHNGTVSAVAACPTFFCTAGEDAILRVWDYSRREILCQISEHKKGITGVIIDNAAEGMLHSVSLDKHVFSYDIFKQDIKNNTTAKKLAYHSDPTGPGLLCVAQQTNNEHELMVGTADGRLLCYDMDYTAPVCTIAPTDHLPCRSVDVSPSGRHMVVGVSDGSVLVLGCENSREIQLAGKTACHYGEVTAVKWSPDEKQLVSVGGDGSICVWNFYDPK